MLITSINIIFKQIIELSTGYTQKLWIVYKKVEKCVYKIKVEKRIYNY